MSDKDIPTSGSRWEPADGEPAGTPAQPPSDPQDAATEHIPAQEKDDTAAQAEHGAVPTDQERRTRLPRRLRGRSAVAAAGVGLVLAGGLGGFAIGHAVTDDGGSDGGSITDADQNGNPDDGHGRPDFGDGHRPAPDGARPDGTDPGDTPDTGDDGGTA